MKWYSRRILREWERCCLWGSALLLTVLLGVHLAALLPQAEAAPLRTVGGKAVASYLNTDTAFGFLEARSGQSEPVRNPFAFSIRLPKPPASPVAPSAPASPAPTAPAPGVPPTPVASPPGTTVAATATPAEPPAPAPLKRAASILFRGLYRGGSDRVRQIAFLSTCVTPGGAPQAVVLGEGEATAGVTLKQLSPERVVVIGPTGAEVTIGIGQQASVCLE